MALVASVQVDDASHASVGAVAMVVAVVGSVCVLAANVVDVAWMFQPAFVPVASLTSNACVWVCVWLAPLSVVAGKVMLAGVLLMKESVPALICSLAVVAPAGAAAANSNAASTRPGAAPLAILQFRCLMSSSHPCVPGCRFAGPIRSLAPGGSDMSSTYSTAA